MEDRRNQRSAERGGKNFKDQYAVQALLTTGNPKINLFCVDMFTIIDLSFDAFETVATGMTIEAAAYKAQYQSLLEARLAISYGLFYPDHVMIKSTKKEAILTQGWVWAHELSTFAAFDSSMGGGFSATLQTNLHEVKKMTQNAIDYEFPAESQPVKRAIFTEQLELSYGQAIGWLDSLTPLYKTMLLGGLSPVESWNRVLVYTKSLFDDIKTVRHVSSVSTASSMISGSFLATDLLKEYVRLLFTRHPQVSSILALTSMQREGKTLTDALAAMAVEAKVVKSLADRVQSVEQTVKN